MILSSSLLLRIFTFTQIVYPFFYMIHQTKIWVGGVLDKQKAGMCAQMSLDISELPLYCLEWQRETNDWSSWKWCLHCRSASFWSSLSSACSLVNPKGLGLLPRGQGERAMCFSDLPGITSGCSLSVDTAPGRRPDKKQAFSKCFLIK